MECKICGNICEEKFAGLILGKYTVKYYFCPACEHLQTEEPYWLEEAYAEPVASEDTGVLQRNLNNRVTAASVISCFFDMDKTFLDYAGGYGVLTRLMRDVGFDFKWQDKYCDNLFARGFEYKNDNKIEIITAFELFEHLENPMEVLKNMFKISGSILFSQNLMPVPVPKFGDWWYYAPSAGQHISFYTKKTFKIIADKFNKNYVTSGEMHLFTDKEISESAFDAVIKNASHIYLQNAIDYKSKIADDMNYIISHK